MNTRNQAEIVPEVAAIGVVYNALATLKPEAQRRVLNYVAKMLQIALPAEQETSSWHEKEQKRDDPPEAIKSEERPMESGRIEDEMEGISPIAKKWMIRNGLTAKQLSTIFSLGVDEIDLIANKVPGENKKEKMRSVVLLKGAAAYLGTGAARFTHEQLKEPCLHYKAYDADHFSSYIKDMASEVGGNKNSAYTLTTRGLANATDLIKTMLQPTKSF